LPESNDYSATFQIIVNDAASGRARLMPEGKYQEGEKTGDLVRFSGWASATQRSKFLSGVI
jgi:hypothetical protein